MDDLTPLLVSASEGDREALAELIRVSQPDVWRFCAALLGPGAADDATQETFVRAWRSAHGFRAEASARTWLLAIARRVCYDQIRRQRRHRDLDDRVRPAPDSDQAAVVDLTDMVDRLDPDRRAAFVLTQLHGLTYAEAAEVCACPTGTIRSRVARARADLLAGMDRERLAPGGEAGT